MKQSSARLLISTLIAPCYAMGAGKTHRGHDAILAYRPSDLVGLSSTCPIDELLPRS